MATNPNFSLNKDANLQDVNTTDLQVANNAAIGGSAIIQQDLAVDGGDLVSSLSPFNLLRFQLPGGTGAGPAAINLGDAAATTTVLGNLVVNGTITPAGGGLNPVIPITTTAVTRPVTAAESGSTFAITKNAAVALTLNLPTPALGLNYTFTQVSPAVGGNTIVINATTNGTVVVGTMGGELQNFGATSVLVGDAAMTALDSTLTFAASSVASDFVRVQCVSTNTAANTLTWVVNGDMSAATQIVPSV